MARSPAAFSSVGDAATGRRDPDAFLAGASVHLAGVSKRHAEVSHRVTLEYINLPHLPRHCAAPPPWAAPAPGAVSRSPTAAAHHHGTSRPACTSRPGPFPPV